MVHWWICVTNFSFTTFEIVFVYYLRHLFFKTRAKKCFLKIQNWCIFSRYQEIIEMWQPPPNSSLLNSNLRSILFQKCKSIAPPAIVRGAGFISGMQYVELKVKNNSRSKTLMKNSRKKVWITLVIFLVFYFSTLNLMVYFFI